MRPPLSLLLLLLVVATTFADYNCPATINRGYVYGSSCYDFVGEEMTWISARSNCQRQNGHLAMVSSSALQSWLSARAESSFPSRQGVWFGLNDRAVEGRFVWDGYNSNDTKSNYFNWNPGEPSGNGLEVNQDCVYMRRGHEWRWGDTSCDWVFRKYSSICEYRAVYRPPPTFSRLQERPSVFSSTLKVGYPELPVRGSTMKPSTIIMSSDSNVTSINPDIEPADQKWRSSSLGVYEAATATANYNSHSDAAESSTKEWSLASSTGSRNLPQSGALELDQQRYYKLESPSSSSLTQADIQTYIMTGVMGLAAAIGIIGVAVCIRQRREVARLMKKTELSRHGQLTDPAEVDACLSIRKIGQSAELQTASSRSSVSNVYVDLNFRGSSDCDLHRSQGDDRGSIYLEPCERQVNSDADLIALPPPPPPPRLDPKGTTCGGC